MYREIINLIRKDVLLELRQRYALNGILLYVLSTVFVAYLSFGRIVEPATWNALFWIIMLFAAVNAVSKSFVQESAGRQLYYFNLAAPLSIIISKTIYNVMLMVMLSMLNLLIFSLLMDQFIQNWAVFTLTLILGGVGLASLLTMIAAIASRTNNNFSLMAVLSFPIVLPLLLTLMKASQQALGATTLADSAGLLLVILLLSLLPAILSVLLFPYLWQD
ncbi:MAG TPA: heme exporter protein CcmB [Bacteroidales bacterium]|nr:heme exporter protein CcmB [Bacteroidales bacterium]